MARPSLTIFAAGLCMAMVACTGQTNTDTAQMQPQPKADTPPATDNASPFAQPSTLTLHAPDFSKIKDSDYQPGFELAMKQQLEEVQKIADNPDAPTFDNTLVELEKSGQMLSRVNMAFNAVTSANTNDALQKVQEAVAPELAATADAIYLNKTLFDRIQAVYDQRDTLKLDPESKRLLEWKHEEFVHNGANLSDADKGKLKDLNREESTLSTSFVNKLLAATKDGALVIEDKAKLAGLPDAEIQAAAQDAEGRDMAGKWLLPLQNTTQQPALTGMTDRDTRQALFEHSWNRTEKGDANDTRETIARIAKIRAEKAKLLGYPNYAAWTLSDQMAKTPDRVFKFVRGLVGPTNVKAEKEAADIQAMIKKDGKDFTLEPWDWNHYSEQVRKERYDLDEDQIKPYFELDNVLQNGVFYAANQLYGLTFKERKDLPTWQPDVRTFEVHDADGKLLGLFYADYFKRDNKGGGAWMDNLVGQSKLMGTQPVIYNVCNFTKPAPGQPALLSWDDVTTMFHEFGHALHGLFADQQYPTLSGTNTARDFVEFPSQFNEHWASYPSVFSHYAKHYKTGERMPEALVAKIKKSSTFNQGYSLGEVLSAALLDLSWHTLPADAPQQDVDKFEAKALQDNHTNLPYLPPRYRSSYFMHIWGNGYAAAYYAYLWTEMLDDDAYGWFEENGGLTRENGDRFRKMILSRGNSQDLAKMYRDFRGRDPKIDGMLENRGLTGVDDGTTK